MQHVEKPRDDGDFVCESYELLIAFSQDVVNVLDEVAEQADLEDERWQVVVQEERSLHEKVRHEVEEVAEEQSEADALKFPPFLVAQINDLSTTPEQVEYQESAVEQHADCGGIPQSNVAKQMDLRLQ
jgi:hypothetical protein